MKSYRPERFDLIKSIKQMPLNCTHLQLDRILQENSDNVSVQTVIKSFKYIPSSVTHLDLSYNELLFKNEQELIALMSAMPLSITHLDLRGNSCIYFGREGFSKQPIKLIILLTALSSKKTLSVLDLRDNVFHTTYFDKLDEASVHPMKPLQPFVDTLYLSSNEIICMSKTKLDRFAKILPIAQDVHFTDEHGQRITSNKINYLARQLVLTDAHLSRLYSNQFFNSLSPISDKKMDNKVRVYDNYPLRKELFYFFLLSQVILLPIEPGIPIGLMNLFNIIQLMHLVDEAFNLGAFKKLNCPVEFGFCSNGSRGDSDICMRFPSESIGEEPIVSCFFK